MANIDFSKILGTVAGAAGTAFLGPVGALAGPLVGAIGNGIFNSAAVERERAWSEKMYNKYNSPSALVRQYQEAGINPALMFGQSAIPAPTTSTAAVAPENPFGDIVGSLGALMQLEMLDANKENIKADTRSKNASAAGLETENTFKPEILRQSLEKGRLDITQTQNAISRFEDELANLRADTRNKEAQANYAAASAMLAIAQRALVGKQGEQIDLANAQTRFEQEFQKEYGFLPNQPLWNALTTTVSHVAKEGIGDPMDSVTPFLQDFGRKAGEEFRENLKHIPENIKNKIEWLKYWSY